MSKVIRRVLLLTSYCSDEPDCTEELPCKECIEMCNVVDIEGEIIHNYGELDFLKIERYTDGLD